MYLSLTFIIDHTGVIKMHTDAGSIKHNVLVQPL